MFDDHNFFEIFAGFALIFRRLTLMWRRPRVDPAGTRSFRERAAAAALSRAGDRFERVDEYGREFSDEEAELEEEMVLSELKGFSYTPNHVFGVRMAPRGPWCKVDCKGFIPPPMRERMIAVLIEELERAGVSARVEVPLPGECSWSDVPEFGP